MSLVDQVKANRRVDLRKLKKDILIDNYIKAEDYFVELEAKIKDLTTKHREEVKGIRKSYGTHLNKQEEIYNQSHSYAYVMQLLEESERLTTEKEYYQSMFEDLQQNGYEDLTKEITLLKNKIVRMA